MFSTNAFPTTLADLKHHLPNTHSSPSVYSTIDDLRRTTLSIPNRLRSVLRDADFVEALYQYLSQHCPLQHDESTEPSRHINCQAWPLIPNERSGSWPLDPSVKLQSQRAYLSNNSVNYSSTAIQPAQQPVSAYFKSTDGHISQWAFSTRRLNLPVLYLLNFCSVTSGAVLIDTTRRGKAYPDALRRTVPIWCTVWNQFLFPELIHTGICDFQPFDLDPSESSQITARIPGFVEDLQNLDLDVTSIRAQVQRPIRCIWTMQPSRVEEWQTSFAQTAHDISHERERWNNVCVSIFVCCSASKRVIGAEMSEDGYIQGAGDDSEGWSLGLTAKLFWDNLEQLMQVADSGQDLEELVKQIVAESKFAKIENEQWLIKPTANLFLGSGMRETHKHTSSDFDIVIDCSTTLIACESKPNSTVLALACKDGKLGSKMLRDKLPQVKSVVGNLLKKRSDARVLVRCSTGKDLSIGVLLVILCCFFTDAGAVEVSRSDLVVDKQLIRRRLAWVTSSKPDANPSRATLQAVNSFLIGRPD